MERETNYTISPYPFTGIPTFLRAPVVPPAQLTGKGFRIGVMGVPFDEGCPFIPGSRFCARAIREQSLRFGEGYYDHQLKKFMLEKEMKEGLLVDAGDVTILPTDVEGNFKRTTDMARELLDRGLLLVALGGDHSISYPVVRAFREPLHVIHLDAHADFLPILPGYENTNTHPFRHISEMEHVKSLTQIGYRSIREASGLDSIRAGNRVIGMDEFRDMGEDECLSGIPEESRCYVSIDIDVLDCGLVPGCVSAEPDGMSYPQLRSLLRFIAKKFHVVGFDMVEVCPPLDVPAQTTAYLASQLVVEFLGNICDQPRWNAEKA